MHDTSYTWRRDIDKNGDVSTANANTSWHVQSFLLCSENIRDAAVIPLWLKKVLAELRKKP